MSLPAITVAVPADPFHLEAFRETFPNDLPFLLHNAALIHLLQGRVHISEVMAALRHHHGDDLADWLRNFGYVKGAAA